MTLNIYIIRWIVLLMNNNQALEQAISHFDTKRCLLLLEIESLDPSYNNNIAIRLSSMYGLTEVVRKLLEDRSVDPSEALNSSISIAHDEKFYTIVQLLWKNKKVKKTLAKDDEVLYQLLVKQDIENKLRCFNE